MSVSALISTTPSSTPQTSEPIVRLVYIDEGIRVVTIAYQLYAGNSKKNIKFAASIFRKQSDKETFVRKQHSHTACERLILRPLWTTFAIPQRYEQVAHYDKEFYEDLKQHLRKEVHKRGTGSKQRLRKVEVKPVAARPDTSRLAIGNCVPDQSTPPAYVGSASVAVRA